MQTATVDAASTRSALTSSVGAATGREEYRGVARE